MKTISISDLRANLLEVINEVKKGKSILVTSHGKPVAQINPPGDRRKEAIAKLKALRKTAIIGDVVSPTDEIWEAN
ncbi:MAG: type II toxin-antitoxin system prevent-host-death family antitoxin [Saprospiraceae bacterium]